MKHSHRRSKESEPIDPDSAEVLFAETTSRSSAARKDQRKALQFCRQVQRALNLALAGRTVGDGINDLFVDEVLPAPDCSRLLVLVLVPDGRPVADAIIALRHEAPRLRSEVASVISRKRAPELCFVPARDGGSDE